MAKFKSAYFLIAGLLFILDQTNGILEVEEVVEEVVEEEDVKETVLVNKQST